MTRTASPLPLDADACYEPLKRLVLERTGLDYYRGREADLREKVKRRMDALRVADCKAYFDLLREATGGRTEFDALVAELTIGETHFFRHREMFDALREIVLPDIVERNRTCRRIRVWSAGCSIGAEPYSMSILIREFLGRRAEEWDVSILGTDINRDYLAKAQQGEFDDWALRSMSDEFRNRHFGRRRERWAILPVYRQHVSFQYHNLIKHRFPSLVQNLAAFDIVLCRNVMIYFNEEVNTRLVHGLYESLVDEGWLVVGHAELQSNLFENFKHVLADGAVLYQKPPAAERCETQVIYGAAAVRPPGEQKLLQESMSAPHFAAVSGANVIEGRSGGDRKSERRRSEVGASDFRPSDLPVSRPPLVRRPEDETDRRLEKVRSLADHGELDQAIAACADLLERRTLCPRVHFHFALLMEQTGRLEEAEQSLRKAIYLDRDDTLAHFYLGLTLLRRGNRPAAVRALETVLDLTTDARPEDSVEGTDEMQVDHLRQLARMHLSLLAEQSTT